MSTRSTLKFISSMSGDDAVPLYGVRRDISGGINNRQAGYIIGENQSTVLENADIDVPGEITKRYGSTTLKDIGDADDSMGLFGFQPDGGTNKLYAMHGTTLDGIENLSTGALISNNNIPDTGFTENKRAKMIQVWKTGGDGSVMLVSNGTDNVHEVDQSENVADLGSTSDDLRKTRAMDFYRGRVWTLKDNVLDFTSAYPSDFVGSVSATTYAINCGEERFVLGIRDMGLIVAGSSSIWGLNPLVTPDATSKPEKIVDEGCAAWDTGVNAGDDIIYLAHDGIRGLFRTQQDKIQLGESQPLSWNLKDEFESISWAYISKATAVWWDGKYIISLPVDASTVNNEVWVYYKHIKAWSVFKGWNIASFAKIEVSGVERLYGIDSTADTDIIYRLWDTSTYNDSGAAVTYTEEGRQDDLGQPLLLKQGGELKIKALGTGDYNLSVSASLDGQPYQSLGNFNIQSGTAPTLPVNLPFTLSAQAIETHTFHLDGLGEWYNIKIKIVNDEATGSDAIRIYERQIITYTTGYQAEDTAASKSGAGFGAGGFGQ